MKTIIKLWMVLGFLITSLHLTGIGAESWEYLMDFQKPKDAAEQAAWDLLKEWRHQGDDGSARGGPPQGFIRNIVTQSHEHRSLFAWAVRHEKAHHDAWHAWWTTGTPPYNTTVNDVDADFLRDALEPTMPISQGGPYDPATRFTFGSQELEDGERHACVTATPWVPQRTENGSDPEDWAKPGNNWKP